MSKGHRSSPLIGNAAQAIAGTEVAIESSARALVRVFVPTYRRPQLLERALASLVAQTLTDWTCELHNDEPADEGPALLARRLDDPRISLHKHASNLGARATFNMFYRPTREPYYSLLEDDNWWEPQFLEVMHREMERHPDVTLGWCNQRIWEELPDGGWRDSGRLVGRLEGENVGLVAFGDPRQLTGALHSHGAMLLRSSRESYPTPLDWPLAGIEAFRERMLPHPMLYVPLPLAAFSNTLQTARNESRAEWGVAQTLLIATFLKNYNGDRKQLANLVAEERDVWSISVIPLCVAALLQRGFRGMLGALRFMGWLRLLRSIVWRPMVFWRMLRCKHDHPDWWSDLDRHTAARFSEKHK
jgi:glycosyltransferase involved in cell wall biosynthesis